MRKIYSPFFACQQEPVIRKTTIRKAGAAISIHTGSSWPSGMYFLQCLYENGRMAASDKIIIQ